MSLPTNTLATYEAIGNREDLADIIYRVDPTDTPFMTGIEKAKATAVKHEWQTQALATAQTTNAVLEGDDAAADLTTVTARRGKRRAHSASRSGSKHSWVTMWSA